MCKYLSLVVCFVFFFSTGAECSAKQQLGTTQEQTSDPFHQIDQENNAQVPVQDENTEVPEEQKEMDSPGKRWYQMVDLEARFALFIPQSNTFQEVYGYLNPAFQLELTFLLPKHLQWWTNFSYINKKGESTILHLPASLKIFSISSGVKYVFLFPNSIEIGLGIGLLYTWLREKNRTLVIEHVKNKEGIGGIAKFDITKIYHQVLFSFFMDYQLQSFSAGSPVENVRVDLSGLYLGLSLGYRF